MPSFHVIPFQHFDAICVLRRSIDARYCTLDLCLSRCRVRPSSQRLLAAAVRHQRSTGTNHTTPSAGSARMLQGKTRAVRALASVSRRAMTTGAAFRPHPRAFKTPVYTTISALLAGMCTFPQGVPRSWYTQCLTLPVALHYPGQVLEQEVSRPRLIADILWMCACR